MKKQVTVAWFSAGITSAVACKYAINMRENVKIYYIETGAAHQDNERFIKECEDWYGQEIIQVKNEKYEDHFHVVEKDKYVNGPGGARCTLKLKKEVRYKIEKELEKEYDEIEQVFGFEFTKKEINRAVRFKEQNTNVKALFPLIEKKLDKNDCLAVVETLGIKKPTMYELGYENNNCIGCVKGGKYYWNKIREDFPEVFDRMAKAERTVGRSCIKDTKGKLFLDELPKNTGRKGDEIVGQCGVVCQVELGDLISKKTLLVLNGDKKINEL